LIVGEVPARPSLNHSLNPEFDSRQRHDDTVSLRFPRLACRLEPIVRVDAGDLSNSCTHRPLPVVGMSFDSDDDAPFVTPEPDDSIR